MKKRSLLDLIPRRMWFPVIFELLWDLVVYYASRLISRNFYHHNLTTPLDDCIPVVPWTVVIYFSCFLFWGISYLMCARRSPERAYRFFCADFLGKAVAMIFFIALPTTNVRPEIQGTGVFDQVMRLLYAVDSPDNLFPSLHCLVSWLCFRGISRDKTVPAWYRVFSCVYCFAIFAVTLTTKQHVILDVIGGVVFAEICYAVAAIPAVLRAYTKLTSPETYGTSE